MGQSCLAHVVHVWGTCPGCHTARTSFLVTSAPSICQRLMFVNAVRVNALGSVLMTVAYGFGRAGGDKYLVSGWYVSIGGTLVLQLLVLYAFEMLMRKSFLLTLENVQWNKRHEHQVLQQHLVEERNANATALLQQQHRHEQKLLQQRTDSFSEMVALIAHGASHLLQLARVAHVPIARSSHSNDCSDIWLACPPKGGVSDQ